MADDFAQLIKGQFKVGDTLSSEDGAIPILVKDSTGSDYAYLQAGTSGGLKVDIADATGITVDVNLDESDDTVQIYGNDGNDGAGTNRAIKTDASGRIAIFDDSQTITVDGAVTVTGSVTVSGDVTSNSANIATETTLSAINTKLTTGTDIGDVTVNNGTGVSAVNIQDGGNTITVDGTVSTNAATSVFDHNSTNLVKDTSTLVNTYQATGTAKRIRNINVSGAGLCTWRVYVGATGNNTDTLYAAFWTTPSCPTFQYILDNINVALNSYITIYGENKESKSSPGSDFVGYATIITE